MKRVLNIQLNPPTEMLATWAYAIPDWMIFALLGLPVILVGVAFWGLSLILWKPSNGKEL
ncbi:MAG: hypothetical protein QNL33_08490 [Akkermansiaceae bacterium]|jgi:hypothetical protein